MTRLAAGSAADPALETESGIVRALVEVTKPGITRLVTITSMLAFFAAWLIPGDRTWHVLGGTLWLEALFCLVGTAVSAAGANALNMWLEREPDALMKRTASRPIPSGVLSAKQVFWFGTFLASAGVMILWLGNGWLPALISALTTLSYVLVYTPSKRMTPYSTVIGSFPGALPTLIGWTAGSASMGLGSLAEPGGWSLFLILFVWQVPHFLAIAWRYADQYAAAGHKVLPAIDPGGRVTSLAMLVWTLCLLPASLAPVVAMPHVAGMGYAFIATLTSLLFVGAAMRLIQTRRDAHARAVFFASIIHLPLLLTALVGEGAIRQIL